MNTPGCTLCRAAIRALSMTAGTMLRSASLGFAAMGAATMGAATMGAAAVGVATVGVATMGAATPAWADPRPFTYTYDLYPEGKGRMEFEQWATWRQGPRSGPGFDRLELREELEFGIADNFDLSVYLPSWSVEDSQSGHTTKLDSIGVEGIVYLSSPVTAPLGVGLYFEAAGGPDTISLEPKLILQKDVGTWTFAYNLVAETEIAREGDENEIEGAIGQTLGVSYAASPTWQLGVEAFVESVYAGWHRYQGSTAYAGPAASFRPGTIGAKGPEVWATLTPTWQLTSHNHEPDFQVRLIAGIEF